ncbi:zinc ribbon-containing protein [Pectobacteriaceae bacterium CE70]|uniref:Zinc ribbon-containing protein n=1 Tax=Serratia sp. (strain ATCC 39006) TaxID=104623 RepID=A0A2I5TAL0_SERS3|nr:MULTISPECIES: zinc ribbon-containing protein [Enterobacterales]WJV59537.1 zinc ribbon-containing protein [Pectobacteriaceae bacterium C111]WJV63778.1 zinc ribbon-containing protein [Pectobacteriaceae bacterium C52]WJV68176.1 zinc ribbon-containing protein [Pectobacteriaceae bacterium CE70]WJY12113.1 zinc ribbon-containing protein [Pectobacteriaceae bacterium C80]WJY13934.1 zinc ribbon-containing protein [Pectobacteriaceae bacterium CE90]
MNKVAHYYRELMSSVSEHLKNGERDLDSLVSNARKMLQESNELTQKEIELVMQAIRRDLEEFARSYEENQEAVTDSVFMRVIKESLWQELADITDKTQLEWREIFKDVNHHGIYNSGEVVGLGNLVCEKCHHHIAFYTPEVLPLCPKCSHNQFHRQPFQP